MDTDQFTALGTTWSITSDGAALTPAVRRAVRDWLEHYEARFSRFRKESEVNQFRQHAAGRYAISETLQALLRIAERVREQTGGRFDPAAGALLERAGYDAAYTFQTDPSISEFVLPGWRLEAGELALDGPVSFDLGGIGKGYAIDRVAEVVQEHGYEYFLIDAGGDLRASTKTDGAPWRVAIEYPGQPELAAGVVALHHAALAVSDTQRRRWGNWHHLVDPLTAAPREVLLGAAAVAPSATAADAMTSALVFAEESQYPASALAWTASYVVFKADATVTHSADWPGELFC